MLKRIFKKIRYELQFNNTQYYTRISEKVFKRRYQKLLAKKVRLLPPLVLQTENAEVTLAILANKRNFYESVAALYSFCFWDRNIVIHYHEDGTLTQADMELLNQIFPGIVVFHRSAQNIKVRDLLLRKGLDKCAQLRDHFIFSLRLFDMIIEKKTPYLLQIDSDVLFFSRPTEIWDVILRGQLNGCYNKDLENAAYTFNNETIGRYLQVPVLKQVNAGVFLHNFDEALFSFSEDILEHEPDAAKSWHLEQTLFAMFASYKGGFAELPKQYDLGRRERALGHEIISEHYVHSTGHDFHRDFIYKCIPQYKQSGTN
jgi:hypothetical protein